MWWLILLCFLAGVVGGLVVLLGVLLYWRSCDEPPAWEKPLEWDP